MKNRLIASLLCIVMLLIPEIAWADTAVNDNGITVVSGSAGDTPNARVMLIVLKEGITAEEFAAAPNTDKCFYLWEGSTDENGDYLFSFPANDSHTYGEYVLMIGGNAGKAEHIMYIHKSQKDLKIDSVISAIRGAVNYGTVFDALSAGAQALGIDGKYSNSELKKIAQKLYEDKESVDYDNYEEAIEKAAKTALQSSTSAPTGGSSGGSASYSVSSSITSQQVTQPILQSPAPVYNDVSASHWAYKSINRLTAAGVISGTGNGLFMPDAAVKREEFAKMLCMVFIGQPDIDVNIFNDVEDNSWYAGYVNAMAKAGFISGRDDGSFGAGCNITRQDAAVMLCNCMGIEDFSQYENETFTDDSEISDYARSAVKYLKGKDILSGFDGGLFMPRENLTRAQAAKILADMI